MLGGGKPLFKDELNLKFLRTKMLSMGNILPCYGLARNDVKSEEQEE